MVIEDEEEEEKTVEVVAESKEEEMDDEIPVSNHFGPKRSAQDRAGVKFPISRLAKFAKDRKYAERVG